MAPKTSLQGGQQLGTLGAAAQGYRSGTVAPVTEEQMQQQRLDDFARQAQIQAQPQLDLIDANIHSLAGQIGIAGAAYTRQSGLTGQESGLQGQLLALQGQGQAIQKGALARQPLLLKQMAQLQGQEYTRERQQQAQGYKSDIEHMNAQNAATGALFTHGAARARQTADMANNFANQRINANQRKYLLNYNEQVKKLADDNKNLDLASKRLGIEKNLLAVKTQEALTQLGLDKIMTISQVFQAMNDAAIGKYNVQSGVAAAVDEFRRTGGAAGPATSGTGPKGVYNPGGLGAGGHTAASPNAQAYIQQILPYAQAESRRTGIPVAVFLAQSGVETGWGTSGWWRNSLNPAGIGVTGAAGAGHGYPSIGAAFTDYANKLMGHGEYGQNQFVADVRAGAPAVKLLQDLQNSPWAAGHYGYHSLVDVFNQMNLGQYR